MPHHGSIVNDDELNEAGWAGAYGAINGAARVCLAMRLRAPTVADAYDVSGEYTLLWPEA